MTIGREAFVNCTSLTSITVASNNPNYASENDILYNKAKTILILAHPAGISGSVTIPASVTEIGEAAFENCTGLVGVTIPNSVTTIGRAAFNGCESLASVTIPASVTSISYLVFNDCTNLTSITFQGVITFSDFQITYASPFSGDLLAKYIAGGIGTYTRTAGSATWTKR